MSALSAHITVLRAEAAELFKLGREDHADGQSSISKGESLSAQTAMTSALILTRMAQAKFAAADALQAQDDKLDEAMRARRPGQWPSP